MMISLNPMLVFFLIPRLIENKKRRATGERYCDFKEEEVGPEIFDAMVKWWWFYGVKHGGVYLDWLWICMRTSWSLWWLNDDSMGFNGFNGFFLIEWVLFFDGRRWWDTFIKKMPPGCLRKWSTYLWNGGSCNALGWI